MTSRRQPSLLAQSLTECGAVASSYADALQDGIVDRQEGERIRTLAQAALRTLRALDEMLEREHPTRLRGVS